MDADLMEGWVGREAVRLRVGIFLRDDSAMVLIARAKDDTFRVLFEKKKGANDERSSFLRE